MNKNVKTVEINDADASIKNTFVLRPNVIETNKMKLLMK